VAAGEPLGELGAAAEPLGELGADVAPLGELGAISGQPDATGAADVGLAAADAAALAALVATEVAGARVEEVVGLAVAPLPPQALTKRAVVTSNAAARRPIGSCLNTASFPRLSTNLVELVERLDTVDRLVKRQRSQTATPRSGT